MVFQFDPIKIKEAEQKYSELILSPYQKGVVLASAKLIAEALNMSELAARGFIGFAIKDWQKEEKIIAQEYYKMKPEEQKNALKSMHAMFYKRVSKIIPESQREQLKATLKETYWFILKAYKLDHII